MIYYHQYFDLFQLFSLENISKNFYSLSSITFIFDILDRSVSIRTASKAFYEHNYL